MKGKILGASQRKQSPVTLHSLVDLAGKPRKSHKRIKQWESSNCNNQFVKKQAL